LDFDGIIADIEAAITGRASDTALERSIDGTTLKYASLDELLVWREKFLALRAMERGEGLNLPGSAKLVFRSGV